MAQLFDIREAVLDDAGNLVQLLHDFGHPATEANLRQRLMALDEDGVSCTWVAERARGELVGLAAAYLTRSVVFDTPTAQLTALVTAADARGTGVGSALCVTFERWAVLRGAGAAVLTSAHERRVAHTFYEHRGYDSSGLRFSKLLKSNGS